MAIARSIGDACRPARLPISLAAAFAFAPIGTHPAQAGCWSVLKSPKWVEVQASLDKAKLCEVIPAGPNRTDRISITRFDICDAPGGFKLDASGSVECKSSPAAVFKSSASGSAETSAVVDIGTCTVTDIQVNLGGTLGAFLSGRPELRQIMKNLAQAKLSELCGK